MRHAAAAYLRGLPMVCSLIPQVQPWGESAIVVFCMAALPSSSANSTPLGQRPCAGWARSSLIPLSLSTPLHTRKPGEDATPSPEASDWAKRGTKQDSQALILAITSVMQRKALFPLGGRLGRCKTRSHLRPWPLLPSLFPKHGRSPFYRRRERGQHTMGEGILNPTLSTWVL